jgi:hypothetical protein
MPNRQLPAFEPGDYFYTVDAAHELRKWQVRGDGLLVIVPPTPFEKTDKTASDEGAQPLKRMA